MLRRRAFLIDELNPTFSVACVACDLSACVQGAHARKRAATPRPGLASEAKKPRLPLCKHDGCRG